MSSPVAYKRSDTSLVARGRPSQSFNHWGGYSSLDNFDEFYGVDDFDHSHHFNPVVVKHEDELVCHTQRIEIIQQRMIVLQEMAKKIITEQICEVETQTIVFQQYHRALGGFHHDLTRGSGRHVGYDNSIVSHYGQIYNSDGSFNTEDWGFKGTDVGSNYYSPSSNWNEETSYDSVGKAYQAAHFATFDWSK
ncbi:hypothetical protein C8J57DRAFT_1131487 [Mycena rebaudengoi]|nr:hypothetical protein C8J57DRAFT_1131487 [Mycena rebaudengoi]